MQFCSLMNDNFCHWKKPSIFLLYKIIRLGSPHDTCNKLSHDGSLLNFLVVGLSFYIFLLRKGRL